MIAIIGTELPVQALYALLQVELGVRHPVDDTLETPTP